MAKLYFSYSAMNAGKSTILLQAAHNYVERGMKTLLLTAELDSRYEKGKISSRIGFDKDAFTFSQDLNIYKFVNIENARNKISCILIDEAQFLTQKQVWELTNIVDSLNIPVMCYGLRTDFQGNLFPGSSCLLALADVLREIRTICHCGKKAIMVVRQNDEGKVIKDGDQIEIGGNEKYVSFCRYHWKQKMGKI